MSELTKLQKTIYWLCFSSFIFLILGCMQYWQCSKNGFFYSEGYTISCNSFYKYGSLFTSLLLIVTAIILGIYYLVKNIINKNQDIEL